jgi:predicted site-specific integrase-resolvase
MDRYGVSRPTVYRWSRQHGLKLTKIGPNCTRILHEDEARWLAGRQGVAQ